MLCSLTSSSSMRGARSNQYVDAAARARIFWYAHVHEGLTTGIRGGRLLLYVHYSRNFLHFLPLMQSFYRSMEDLDAFQLTLPRIPEHTSPSPEAFALQVAFRFSKTPLRVSAACRMVHACLTGPRARQRPEINGENLQRAWESLDAAWDELDSLLHSNTGGLMQPDDVEVFANGWQVSRLVICHWPFAR